MKRIAAFATLFSLSSASAAAAPGLGAPPPEGAYDPTTSGSVGFEPSVGFQGPTESVGAVERTVDGEVVAGQDYTDVDAYLQQEGLTGTGTPEFHVVMEGDTLWDICDQYFRDPYAWPKVWSYNEQITNAHWIFPGDRVRLAAAYQQEAESIPLPLMDEAKIAEQVLDLGVLSRYAFIDDEQLDRDMTVVGGHQAKVMLGQYDTIYLDYNPSNPPVAGERLAIYKPQRKIHDIKTKKNGKKKQGESIGYLVEIVGEVNVTRVAKKTAEAYVPGSVKPIERGMRAGELRPIFVRGKPIPADITEHGIVVHTLEELALGGEHQMVIVNFGAARGLKRGHVLSVIHKGDAYSPNHTLDSPYEEGHPRRTLARMIVLETQENASLAMVFDSTREVLLGDHVEIRSENETGGSKSDGSSGPKASGNANASAKDGKAEAEAGFKFGG